MPTGSILSPSIEATLTTPASGALTTAPNGSIVIDRLFVETEGTEISLSGTISVDEQGYPSGVLDTEIVKPAGLGRVLGKTGALPLEEAQAVETGLALMAVAGGGKITAPIILADGAVSIAGIKLAEMQRIE